MTVEIYRSTDASAPVLTGQVGSLITLLDAVLVNGYGAKAAAGWAKAFSATNKAAYRMPAVTGSPGESVQRYFRIDDDLTSTPYTADVRMYDSMTSISIYDGEWKVPKFGSGAVYIRKSITSDATARPWTVIASGRGFYCFFANASTTYGVATTYDFNGYFGDFISYIPGDSWATVIMGHAAASTSSSLTTFGRRDAFGVFAGVNSGRFARSNAFGYTLGSDLSFTTRSRADESYIGAAIAGSGVDYPDPIRGGLALNRVELVEYLNGRVHIRGYMPGLWVSDCRNPPGAIYDTFNGSWLFDGVTFIMLSAYSSTSAGRIYLELSNTWW